jgi:phosphoserine aminotransferase
MQPMLRPRNPHFSSGPCAKRPGWSLAALEHACLARSHRSPPGKAKLAQVIEGSKRILGMPEDWRLAIVPASDTGAIEMALWSLLGPKGVDVLAWENFGATWLADVTKELRLEDVRGLVAPYGALPDLAQVDFDRDVVFTWNGTTSGVRVPDGDWIADDRTGLVICDATSAAFAMPLAWDKLDVATWSWQKALGGEAQHGMLALGPRAVERLKAHTPSWPVPKLFRMAKAGKLQDGLFKGETINTPSLLAVEDALDGLAWAERIGGLPALVERTNSNFAAIQDWVGRAGWVEFLASAPETRSPTSVCLTLAAPWVRQLAPDAQAGLVKRLADMLEAEAVAFDIAGYREAPPGLRIWAGATIERSDLDALFPWLDWAFGRLEADRARAA